MLALDLDGDHRIDKWNEISFASYKDGALTDLEGLQAFDSNHDGKLDKLDVRWLQFGAWVDANADGVCDAGEFKNLDDVGIASINLASDHVVTTPVHGVTQHGQASFTTVDGKTHAVGDAEFAVDAAHRLPSAPLPPDHLAVMPVERPLTPCYPEEAIGDPPPPERELLCGFPPQVPEAEITRQALLFNQWVTTASAGSELGLGFVDNENVTGSWVHPELDALVDSHKNLGLAA